MYLCSLNVVSDVGEQVIDTQQKRPSKETSVNLYKQLTSVLDEIPSAAAVSLAKSKVKAAAEIVSCDGDTSSIHGNDPVQELRDLFVSKNIVTLQQLNGSDVLLEVCIGLAYLKRYKLSFEDAVKGKEYSMPSGMTEALSIRMRLALLLFALHFCLIFKSDIKLVFLPWPANNLMSCLFIYCKFITVPGPKVSSSPEGVNLTC